MSKAGPRLLRTTLIRAAETARHLDPQLARLYYVQVVERGACHLKALCVVAAHLGERAWAVLARGTPPTSSAMSTALWSLHRRPRPWLPTGRCPTTCDSADAAGRAGSRRGRPLTKSTRDMQRALAARTRGDLPQSPS